MPLQSSSAHKNTKKAKKVHASRVLVHNVYGFTTEGIHWRLIIYDGNTFNMSDEIKIMAPDMGTDKARWMQDYSIIIDVLYYVLYNSV